MVMRKKQRHIVRKQLYETLYPEKLHLDFIAALAGDRDLTADEQKHFQRLQAKYGDKVYMDMLFVLTHQYFPEEKARYLWENIIYHKNNMEKFLGRFVGISVAAMDYLANIDETIEEPCVISKGKISQIAEIALKDGLTQLFDVSTFRTNQKRTKLYTNQKATEKIESHFLEHEKRHRQGEKRCRCHRNPCVTCLLCSKSSTGKPLTGIRRY
jgi:hypothetical protein